MRKIVVLLAVACVPSTVAAQGPSGGPLAIVEPDLPDLPPVLHIQEPGASRSVRLSRARVDVRIVGHLAETTLTTTFRNTSGRILEGELYVPLPQGATLSGYALDVHGVMVEGVVVARDRARQIFETEVRKGVDPGIVEWARGNNFKTRVYPIPARGSRTVRVRYVTELVDSETSALFHLPLGFRDRVDEIELSVEVVDPGVAPVIRSGGPTGLRFVPSKTGFASHRSFKKSTLTEDLFVELPDLENHPVQVEVDQDGHTYFSIRDQVPASIPRDLPGRSIPSRIAIYWDASLSRKSANLEAELKLLDTYLGRLGKSGEVVLTVFRDTAERPRRFRLADQKEQLLTHLGALDYDGGTQLGAVAGVVSDSDLNLLFTDGVSNFGADDPGLVKAPTYVVNSSATSNHAAMRQVASRSGGGYINLPATTLERAVDRIGKTTLSFLSAEATGAEVGDLYPRLRTAVDGSFHLAGRLTAGRAIVTLNYGFSDEVIHKRTFVIERKDANHGSMLRRFWAQKQLADLLVRPKRNAQRITELGRRHSIVTPGTSLIVLESLDQYLEHQIRPPASLAEMRASYDSTAAERVLVAERQKSSRLARVVQMWEARKTWWQQRYRYPKNYRFREPEEEMGAVGGASGSSRSARRRAPARSPQRRESASPASAPVAGEPSDDSDGVVRAEKSGENKEARGAAAISINAWDPDTPYLRILKKTQKQARYAAYLRQRDLHGSAPAFYLDCAHFFRSQGRPALAMRVLSNLAEMELDNAALLRVLGHRLSQVGALDLSALIFERVLTMRPEEPQSYRDLAGVLARRAAEKNSKQAVADYQRAIKLLSEVVMGQWSRFDEIEVIALTELNNLLPHARRAGLSDANIDSRLIAHLDMDIRIVMSWDADNTDMDLHVVEPSGEEAYYGHNRTRIGGMVSRDFTQGYGPEVYAIRRAMPGTYKITTSYFGTSAAKLSGAVTLQVDIYTNFGRDNEKRKSMTLRLSENKERFTVGEISF